MEERLIEIFKEYLPAWSWEEWQAAGASDKEDIVINALADLGPDMPIDVDEAYDIFWDWAAGITEADFGRKITESTAEDPYGYGPYKVPTDPKLEVGDYIKAKRYSSDTKWYPARVTRITPDFVDYTISGFGFIKNGTAVRSASAKQAFGNLRKRLLGEACDSNLNETISPEEKARVAAENEARFAKLAELEAERAARAKERSKQLAIQGAENAIAKGIIDEYNKYWRQSILSTNSIRPAIDPETKELVFDIAEKKRILNSIRTNESLEEAVRIGAGNDALYHYTNLIPFMNILKTDTMKRPDDHEDYAICFTTDEGYRIYEFCFGLQFSRERLAADGYDLMLWDDAEEDNPEYADFYRDHPRAEDARTESEERIYDNIPNVSKYITDIHLHWSPEGKTLDQASDEYDNKDAFIDIAHGKQGDKLIGYEGPNDRMVLVPMSEFKAVLLSLKSKGVRIHTYGTRMRKMYVYDERGKVHEVPAYMRMPKVAEPALV